MNVEKIVVGPVRTNCYILYDKGECVIVDPGGEPDKIMNFILENGLKTVAILATHGHFDHILAVNILKKKLKAPFYVNKKEKDMLSHFKEHGKLFLNLEFDNPPSPDGYLDTNSAFKVGSVDVTVHETPGHTNGSCTLEADGNLFTGDFIFAGSIGRVDVGGSPTQMNQSLRWLRGLKTDYQIYPGHGGFTSLNTEKRDNPFLYQEIH